MRLKSKILAEYHFVIKIFWPRPRRDDGPGFNFWPRPRRGRGHDSQGPTGAMPRAPEDTGRNTQNWSKFVDSKFQVNFQILPTLTFRCGFLDLRILWTWFNFCYIPQVPNKLLDTFKTSRGSMKKFFIDPLEVFKVFNNLFGTWGM